MPAAADTIELAMEAYLQGRLEEAESGFNSALEEEPGMPDALHGLGLVAHLRGDLTRAREQLEAALKAAPSVAMYRNNLGVVMRDSGNPPAAEALFLQAMEIDPLFRDAYVNLGLEVRVETEDDSRDLTVPEALAAGVEEYRTGNHERGRKIYRAILELHPVPPRDCYFLRVIARTLVDFETAVMLMAEAASNPGLSADLFNNLAAVFRRWGKHGAAVRCLERVVEQRPDDARSHFNLGVALERVGGARRRMKVALRKATELDPTFLEPRVMLSQSYRRTVSAWHFPMMNDADRNQMFQKAIEACVGDDAFVLDIGAGSGLLSMMAAKAGAVDVVACEMVEDIAEVASEIVASNGYADRIRVVNKSSQSLKVGLGGELKRRADLIVAEIFDAGLFGEKAVETLEHARTHLLKEGGIIIPGRATVHGVLVESYPMVQQSRVREVNTCGFDLSLFNQLGPVNYSQVNAFHHDYRVSTAVDRAW